MHLAIRDIESLLPQHQQARQTTPPPTRLPPELTTRFSAWLDSGAPALIAITMTALLALGIGLASAAFAFIPVTTATDSIIAKTDSLRTPTHAETADKGYNRLKDRFCQAAFNGLILTADRAERGDARQKTESGPLVTALTPPSDIRPDKRRRKHDAGHRIRYRTSGLLQGQTKRQPSLIERFTGVRL